MVQSHLENLSDTSARITALTAAQVARILSAAGKRQITEAMVRADLDAGAPTNHDGTINLVHYAAWLLSACLPAQAGDAQGGTQEAAGGD